MVSTYGNSYMLWEKGNHRLFRISSIKPSSSFVRRKAEQIPFHSREFSLPITWCIHTLIWTFRLWILEMVFKCFDDKFLFSWEYIFSFRRTLELNWTVKHSENLGNPILKSTKWPEERKLITITSVSLALKTIVYGVSIKIHLFIFYFLVLQMHLILCFQATTELNIKHIRAETRAKQLAFCFTVDASSLRGLAWPSGWRQTDSCDARRKTHKWIIRLRQMKQIVRHEV